MAQIQLCKRYAMEYFDELVIVLPMNDPVFIAKLSKCELLPSNITSQLEAQPTSADKASYFFNHVIKPALDVDDTSSFNKLLSVMEDCGYDHVKNVACKIKSKICNTSDIESASIIEKETAEVTRHLKARTLTKLDGKFARALSKIMRIIEGKKFEVQELIVNLCAVDRKKLTVFSTDDALNKIQTYRMLSHQISQYCSICDYELLEAFVESTDCPEAIEVLTTFTDEMHNSILKELNLLSDCGKMLNPDDLMPGTYKFAIEYVGGQCTLETKITIQNVIREHFHLQKGTIVFKGVEMACVFFVYQISAAVKSYLLEYPLNNQNLIAFAAHKITRLLIDGIERKIPLKLSQKIIKVAQKSVYEKYDKKLMKCLPMEDTVFLANLFKYKLLSGYIMNALKALPTEASKAYYFLDQVIKPALDTDDNSSFNNLLSVMENCDNMNVAALACEIKAELNKGSDDGADVSMDIWTTVDATSNYLRKVCIDSQFLYSAEEWPPYQPKNYTALALIHHKDEKTDARVISVTQELVAAENIKPKAKSVMSSVASKDLSYIFMPVTASDGFTIYPSSTILIEGAPGIGKTMLVKEIAHQWGINNLLISKKLFFLIFLSQLNLKNIVSVEGFLQLVVENDKIPSLMEYLFQTQGEDLVIIFDGYDDISNNDRENSIIGDIIDRKIFVKCCIVITSRPSASSHLHSIVNCRVEILGFTEEDRMDYIHNALKSSNHEVIEPMHHYLQDNRTINALCYVPLNMTILLYLVKNGIDQLPKTQAEMYENFIKMTIIRFIRKADRSISVTSFSMLELPIPYNLVFMELTRLAYKGLKDGIFVFALKEIQENCPNLAMISSNWNGLGLLKVNQYFNSKGISDHITFHFLHISIQEYMAAFYISTLPDSRQIKLLAETFWQNHFYNTWRMYIGITRGQSFAFKHFLSGNWFSFTTKLFKSSHISRKILGSKIKLLHLSQCLVELGDNHPVIPFFQSKQAHVDLSDQTLLPSDVNTLGFFLSRHGNKHWEMLNLSGCSIGNIGSNILCNIFLNSHSAIIIQKIDFSHNQLTLSTVMQLFDLFRSWHTSDITIIDSGIVHDSSEIYSVIEDNVILNKSNMRVILQFNTFYFSHGIVNTEFERDIVILKNEYLLNCKWVLTNIRLFNVELHNFHIINTSFPFECLKSVYNALLINPAQDIRSLYVYNNVALSDQNVDEISSLISSRMICGVMLIISKGKVQGMVNIVTLSSVLSKLEILNLVTSIRMICSNNMQTCSWRQELYSSGSNSDLIIYTFIGLLYRIACRCCTCFLRIALREKDTLIAQSVDYKTLKSFLVAYGPAKSVYLSDCEIQNEEYRILCYYATKFYIFNSSLDDVFISKMLNSMSSKKEIFIHSSCDIDTNALMPDSLQKSSVLLVTKNMLFGCKPTVEQIWLALQLEPLISIIKLSNCKGNFELFNQIVAILDATARSWVELDLSYCSIGEVEYDYLCRYLEAGKCLSAIKTLQISLAKLTKSVLPTLLRIILMWKVENIIFYEINCDFYKHFISRIFNTDNASLGYILRTVTYNLEKVCFSCSSSPSSISSILTVENMNLIACNLLLNQDDVHCYQIYIINKTLHEMQSQMMCVSCFTQLQEIKISDYDLQVTGNIAISNASCTLTKLCFKKNCITTAGISPCDVASTIANNSYLQELDISDNDLQAKDAIIIFKALQDISTLTKLYIGKNNITYEAADDLAAVISCNYQLNELDVSNNDLQEAGARIILKALQGLSTLQKLYISKNNITDEAADDIGAAISFSSQLQELDISDNDLHLTGGIIISKALQGISMLTKLYIGKNNITDVPADCIATAISYNSQLRELDVSETSLQTTGAITISKALQGISTLAKLYMNKNNIGEEAAIHVAGAITCNSQLQELAISDNELQVVGVKTILKALRGISTLTKLYISKNNISEEAAIHVANAISCNTQLQELDISDNNLAKGTIIVSKSLQGISTLKKLCISNNNITSDVANHIAAFITCNIQLQELDISRNYLKTQGAIEILQALQGVSSLTKLYVSENNITDDAASYIATVISCNIQLQELDISRNYLQTSGIIKIFKALQSICTLTKLSISNNNISSKAANHIAAVISCNTQLQELDISDNNLQTSGALKVLKALQHISTLTKLSISNNNITKMVVDDIAVVISCNTRLQELDICESELPTSVY